MSLSKSTKLLLISEEQQEQTVLERVITWITQPTITFLFSALQVNQHDRSLNLVETGHKPAQLRCN
jgi:hypothetical protein